MNFLIDADLPPALAQWLRSRDDEALYVDDVLPPPAQDDEIWALAHARNMVIVTKDADFAARAARDRSVRVVWIRCGNLKLSVFQVWFTARGGALRRLLDMGEQLVSFARVISDKAASACSGKERWSCRSPRL